LVVKTRWYRRFEKVDAMARVFSMGTSKLRKRITEAVPLAKASGVPSGLRIDTLPFLGLKPQALSLPALRASW
jgi:hypothetical protein